MRAAPPLAFTVRRLAAWRAALLVLALAGCAVMSLWWLALELPRTGWATLLAGGGVVFALLPLAEACRLRPLALRWDGACWHAGSTTAQPAEPRCGRLGVAADLGGWILLRFVADPAVPPAPWWRRGDRLLWVGLQRRGLEAQWHAIRCAVFAPPAAELPAAARPPA